jgi:tRNA pseudouridine55 synthase
MLLQVKGALKNELGARQGCKPTKVKLKVGHGGTLDPLATGVLVIGVGTGCRDLESYLKGKKRL